MPRLAPVAALVRGIDEGWRRARQRVQEVARVEASERVRLAQDEADVNEERDALRAKVSLLEEELVSAEELLNEAADKANDLQQAASSAEDLRVQMEYWKTLYHGQFGDSAGSPPAADDDPWADIPVLTSKVSRRILSSLSPMLVTGGSSSPTPPNAPGARSTIPTPRT